MIMKTFKDFFKEDVDALLFNTDEAARTCTVDGREMPVVIDEARLTDLKAKARFADGIGTAVLLIFVRAGDLGYYPASGSLLTLDGITYRVQSVAGDLVYEIVLEENSP